MNIIKQFSIIFGFYLAGEFITLISGVPVPGSILGMLLLLLAFYFKLLKVEDVKLVSDFMLKNMIIFFIPSTISIMVSYHILDGVVGKVVSLVVISTIITIMVTAIVVQIIANIRDNINSDKNNNNG